MHVSTQTIYTASIWTCLDHLPPCCFFELMLHPTTRGQLRSIISRTVCLQGCWQGKKKDASLFKTTTPKNKNKKNPTYPQSLLHLAHCPPPVSLHPLSAVIAVVLQPQCLLILSDRPWQFILLPKCVSRAHEAKRCSLSFRWLIGIMWTDTRVRIKWGMWKLLWRVVSVGIFGILMLFFFSLVGVQVLLDRDCG